MKWFSFVSFVICYNHTYTHTKQPKQTNKKDEENREHLNENGEKEEKLTQLTVNIVFVIQQ